MMNTDTMRAWLAAAQEITREAVASAHLAEDNGYGETPALYERVAYMNAVTDTLSVLLGDIGTSQTQYLDNVRELVTARKTQWAGWTTPIPTSVTRATEPSYEDREAQATYDDHNA